MFHAKGLIRFRRNFRTVQRLRVVGMIHTNNGASLRHRDPYMTRQTLESQDTSFWTQPYVLAGANRGQRRGGTGSAGESWWLGPLSFQVSRKGPMLAPFLFVIEMYLITRD